MIVPENVANQAKTDLESGQHFVKVAKTYALDKNQKFDMHSLPQTTLTSLFPKMPEDFTDLETGSVVLILEKGSVTILKLASVQPLQDQKVLRPIAKQKTLAAKRKMALKLEIKQMNDRLYVAKLYNRLGIPLKMTIKFTFRDGKTGKVLGVLKESFSKIC